MQKQLNMKIKPIRTEEDYNNACRRIYEIIHSSEKPIEPNSKKGEELEILSVLVENYEKKMNYKLNSVTPTELIKMKMKEKNLRQTDLVGKIGSKSYISKILNNKIELSLEIIKKFSAELNIPINLLL